MSEVITEQDKEYEAREQAAAPGDDQPMNDRVNNRSLRPRSDAFVDFMSSGWDNNEPEIERLESASYIPARLQVLSEAFPGERLVIPAGQPKVRNNDCDYAFRPDSAFSYYTGLGQDYEAGAVLVLDPNEDGTHTPMLFVAPRADHYTQDFFKDPHYGEYWVGPRAGLKELEAMTGIETHDIAQLDDMLGKDVGTENGAVQLRVIRETDPQITAIVNELRAKGDQVSLEEIERNVRERDKADMGRAISPLRQAEDAIVLDNSCMTVGEQMAWFMKEFEQVTR